jgi:hypothetical protein
MRFFRLTRPGGSAGEIPRRFLLNGLKTSIAQTTLRVGLFLLLSAALAHSQTADSTKPNLSARLENSRVEAIDSNYESISLTDCISGQPDPSKIVCNGRSYRPKISDLGLRAQIKLFHVGDHLRLDINDKGELLDLRGAWSVPKEPICIEYRLLILTVCALALFGLATAATRGKPLSFIIGMDNRYSNSKFQLALWFWVLISTYLATVIFRVWFAGWDFFGGVSIPTHILELSGLSAITYGGAKAITTAKVEAAKNPVTPPGAAIIQVPNPNPKPSQLPGQESFFTDLVQNDQGGFDFGDFQMLVVTFIAVGMYLMLIIHFLGSVEFLKTATLPDVDTTILATFGLGQGAYLAKKAGGTVGTT